MPSAAAAAHARPTSAVVEPVRKVALAAVCELMSTTALLFAIVTVVRWLIGLMPTGGSLDAWPAVLWARVAFVAVLIGIVIALLISSPLGTISGSHMNQAITVSLWVYGALPGRRVMPYLIAQALGSVAGTALARLVWGSAVAKPPTSWAVVQPGEGIGWFAVAIAETLVMAGIVAAMCIVMTYRPSWPLPWIIGAMIAAQAAALGLLTGGCANPSRQIGPALLSGQIHMLAVYLIAPVAGGTTAAAACRRLAPLPVLTDPSRSAAPSLVESPN